MCLECDKEFENKLNVAICPECLEAEKEKYEKGIPSKYKTVNIYLQERCKT
jgi:Zn finger protein HypA/HybF involved in hydrogenase expression